MSLEFEETNVNLNSIMKVPEMSGKEMKVVKYNLNESGENHELEAKAVLSNEAVQLSKIITSQNFKDDGLILNKDNHCQRV